MFQSDQSFCSWQNILTRLRYIVSETDYLASHFYSPDGEIIPINAWKTRPMNLFNEIVHKAEKVLYIHNSYVHYRIHSPAIVSTTHYIRDTRSVLADILSLVLDSANPSLLYPHHLVTKASYPVLHDTPVIDKK